MQRPQPPHLAPRGTVRLLGLLRIQPSSTWPTCWTASRRSCSPVRLRTAVRVWHPSAAWHSMQRGHTANTETFLCCVSPCTVDQGTPAATNELELAVWLLNSSLSIVLPAVNRSARTVVAALRDAPAECAHRRPQRRRAAQHVLSRPGGHLPAGAIQFSVVTCQRLICCGSSLQSVSTVGSNGSRAVQATMPL